MFVYSVKSSKIKMVLLITVIVLAIGALFLLSRGDKSAANDGGISLKAGNAEERIAFLSQFGWEVKEDPVEVTEILIPAEFDQTYENYNKIQKGQDLDLSLYAGKRVKRWTYEIKNYPGYENKDGTVQANILVFNGLVIGGDISSLELNGFMQGFDFPNKDTATTQNLTQAAVATTAA